MKKRILLFVVVGLSVLAGAAHAEIEKHATVGDQGLELHWWPKLAVPQGWVHLTDASEKMQANVLVPKGKTFANADTVFYGRAFYHDPKEKGRETLAAFIKNDLKESKEHYENAEIVKVEPLVIAGGKKLECYELRAPGKAFERFAYGREGNFDTIFVASSQTESGLKKSLPAFQAMLAKYK